MCFECLATEMADGERLSRAETDGDDDDGIVVTMRPNRAAMTARDARSMHRVIVKQGYLRKLPNGKRLGSLFKVC